MHLGHGIHQEEGLHLGHGRKDSGDYRPCIISAILQRLQLDLNEEKEVTLKHMVARLVVPDYGGRKGAMTQTADADMVDCDQSGQASGS